MAPALPAATRDALLAVSAAPQRTIAARQERSARLEQQQRLGMRGTGMPGLTPAASTRSKASGPRGPGCLIAAG